MGRVTWVQGSSMRLGFIEALTLVLIVLKILKLITCSWWLVLAPMLLLGGIWGLLMLVWVIMTLKDPLLGYYIKL